MTLTVDIAQVSKVDALFNDLRCLRDRFERTSINVLTLDPQKPYGEFGAIPSEDQLERIEYDLRYGLDAYDIPEDEYAIKL